MTRGVVRLANFIRAIGAMCSFRCRLRCSTVDRSRPSEWAIHSSKISPTVFLLSGACTPVDISCRAVTPHASASFFRAKVLSRRLIRLHGQLCAAPLLTSVFTDACSREVAAVTAARIEMDQGNKSACPFRLTADKTLGNYDRSAFGCMATKRALRQRMLRSTAPFASFIGSRAAAPFNSA